MKATSGKTCKTCNACKQIYRRWCVKFWSDKRYYCAVRGEMTKRECSCGKWRKKKTVYDLSARRFDEVEQDIKVLKEFFKDR